MSRAGPLHLLWLLWTNKLIVLGVPREPVLKIRLVIQRNLKSAFGDQSMFKASSAATFVCIVAILSGCASNGVNPNALKPYGVKESGPAIIQAVTTNDSTIRTGDTVLNINGNPVTAYDIYSKLTRNGNAAIKTTSGITRTVKTGALLKDNGTRVAFSTLPKGGTFIFRQTVPAYQRKQDSAYMWLGPMHGLVSASIWGTHPRILELYIDLRAESNCKTCYFKNIAVMDKQRRAWLSPIKIQQAAWLVYPERGASGPLVNVPPPTPVGATSTSIGTGTVDGYLYGNSLNGTYAGVTNTTTRYQYNYTATMMAEASNLATILARNHAKKIRQGRRAFLADRVSNMHFGKMASGEHISGYLDYVIPDEFSGPFLVVIQSQKRTNVSRFIIDADGD